MARKNRGTVFLCDRVGRVGTVVGYHIRVQQFCGIVLLPDTVKELPDHVFLIPCGNQNRISVRRFYIRIGFRLPEAGDDQVHVLVRVQGGKQYRHHQIECYNPFHFK